MSKKAAHIKIGELKSDVATVKNLEISIGRIFEETWEEPVGPHGTKYRRMLLGRKDCEEDWYVYDARTGERVYAGPVPEHLFVAAETKEEAMVMIAKLCMRPNDTTKGRAIKLTHYIDLHKRLYGVVPSDIHLFVRTVADVPVTMKDEIIKILEEKKWKEQTIPDPTLLPRLIRKKKE
ncbi:MAG: hypothetical protein QXW63_05150 [Candidatus Bathyarchaeia archaeon]